MKRCHGTIDTYPLAKFRMVRVHWNLDINYFNFRIRMNTDLILPLPVTWLFTLGGVLQLEPGGTLFAQGNNQIQGPL